MKKILILFLSCILIFTAVVPASAISAQSAILIEAETGAVLYEHNAAQKLPMASTTKIMTAVVALENALLDDKIKVSALAAGTEGSSMYLKEGEIVTVRELLYGLMLSSGNDAANALAEHVGGTVADFVRMMNGKAAEIGMKNTSFATPSGLDGEGHYSTAYDMAILAAYALKNAVFAEIVATKAITIGERYLVNHNRLLFSYRYAIGVKTGYTIAAGRCLVSAARKDGVTLIAVTLSDRNDWNDHISMYETAFSKIVREEFCSVQDTYKVPVVGAYEKYVNVSPERELYGIFVNGVPVYTVKIYLPRFLYAPLENGDIVGEVIVELEGREPITTDLVVCDEIVNNEAKQSLRDRLFLWFYRLFG